MKYICFAALSLALSASATAEDTAAEAVSGWKVERFTQSVDKRGSAREDYVYSGVKAETTDTSQPQIILTCSQHHGLVATLFPIPRDQIDPDKPRKRAKLKRYEGKLSIDERDPVFVPWLVAKRTGALQSMSTKASAMVFNAISTDTGFTLRSPIGPKHARFDPPAPDPVFKLFIENCHITNKSKSGG